MGKSIKGTQTEKNLLTSFAGESQARNRYTFAAKAAKKEGYEQIAAIFLETAENERSHAKLFFRQLEGGNVEVNASFPAGIIGNTAANLEAAAQGENAEWTKIYKEAGETAQSEGLDQIARLFFRIAEVEQEHEKRYRAVLKNVKEGTVFKKETEASWKCRVCGHVIKGKGVPKACPLCSHPQAFYELKNENY